MSSKTPMYGILSTLQSHSGAVAQWIVIMLGWLWLGEQGSRLGWSNASGVLAVSFWWAARILFRGQEWVFNLSSKTILILGALVTSGVWIVPTLNSNDGVHVVLLGLALVWGAWTAIIETRSRSAGYTAGRIAWQPIVASVLVLSCWNFAGFPQFIRPAVTALMGACAGVLYWIDCDQSCRKKNCHGSTNTILTILPASAMGLMMGDLWLGNSWCTGLGWSFSEMGTFHLLLMSVLPSVVALAVHKFKPSLLENHGLSYAMLLPLFFGLGVLFVNNATYVLFSMLLPSISWAFHCNRTRTSRFIGTGKKHFESRTVAFFLGPVLLVWVGSMSQILGPFSMQCALALLGFLAGLQLLVLTAPDFHLHLHFSRGVK